jgi:hypothetical protein
MRLVPAEPAQYKTWEYTVISDPWNSLNSGTRSLFKVAPGYKAAWGSLGDEMIPFLKPVFWADFRFAIYLRYRLVRIVQLPIARISQYLH